MFCTKCGKELFDEAVMCPACGTPTENFVEESEAVPAEIPANQIQDVYPSFKTGVFKGEIPEKPTSKDLGSQIAEFVFLENEIQIEVMDNTNTVVKQLNAKCSDVVMTQKKVKYSGLKADCLVLKISGEVISVLCLAPLSEQGLVGKMLGISLSSGNDKGIFTSRRVYDEIIQSIKERS